MISKTASDRLDRSVDRLGHSFVSMERGFGRKSCSIKLFQLLISIARLLSEFKNNLSSISRTRVLYIFCNVKIKRKIAIQRKFFNISNDRGERINPLLKLSRNTNVPLTKSFFIIYIYDFYTTRRSHFASYASRRI